MKRNYFVFLIVLIIGSMGNISFAQEQRVVSQFFMNPYVYNPAYAGVDGHTTIFTMYRMQWVGIDGAPTFANLSFHTPLKNGIAVGALATNDRENQIQTSTIKGSASYLIALDKKHYLRFGMSLGVGYSSYDLSELNITNDPAFQDLSSTSFAIADIGVSYHFDHFNIGISVPNLLGRKVVSKDGFSPISFAPLANTMIKINYRGHINDDFAIEPHFIYRYSNVSLPQYEAAVILHIKHLIWAGAAFRQDAGMTGLFGFKVAEKLAVGFAYEIGNSDINQFSSGSFEINVGFHLGDKKKHHSHSHSFIKSHSKSKADRERAEQRRQLALDKRKQAAEVRAAEVAATVAAANAVKEAEAQKQAEEIAATDVESPAEDEIVNNSETGEIEKTELTQTEEVVGETTPEVIDTPTENVATIDPNATSFKRGNHFIELKVGHHVIAGVFDSFQSAEDLSDQLFQRGYHNAKIGFVTATGKFYTVIFDTDDINKAEAEKNRVKNARGMSKAWVLTITE